MLDQCCAELLLLRRPDHRLVSGEGTQCFLEPSVGQIPRRFPLPVDLLPRDLGDLRRAVFLLQFRKQPAALDRTELPVVAGQHHLGPRQPRFSQHLARHLGIHHRRLVDHHQGAPVPLRTTVFQPEQFRVYRRASGKSLLLHGLRHRVGRGQTDHAIARQLMPLPDRAKRKTLSRPGPAFNDLQAARTGRMVKRSSLVRPQLPARCQSLPHACANITVRPCGNTPAIRQRLPLLIAYPTCRPAPDGLARLAVMQGKNLVVIEHFRLGLQPLALVPNVLLQMPIEIVFGKARLVARQHRQHLLGIARRLLVGFANKFGTMIGLGIDRPHAHRPDVLLRHGTCRIDPDG